MKRLKSLARLALAFAAACTAPAFAQTNNISVATDPLPTQRLTLTTVANGTQTRTSTLVRGVTVRMQATVAPGYQFTAWGQACSGSTATCVLTLSSDLAVTARFNPVLTAAVTGSGRISASGISCGTGVADCTEAYAPGSPVQLSAVPDAGQVFSGWTGACTGTATTCSVTMSGPLNVRATFAAAPATRFALTVGVTGGGSVTSSPAGITCGSDCSESYAASTVVTLTAAANAGQGFTGWGGACSGTGTCTVTMSQARSVTATFGAASTGPVYYFSDCHSGAVAGCVAGNDANPGTSPQAPRRTLAGLNVDALPPGTQLLFARGGVWTNFGLIISNPNVTTAQPMVFGSYASVWGGSTRPTLRAGSSLPSVFIFGWHQETLNDGGYVIRGLKLEGQAVEGAGIFVGNNVHDVLLEDLDISNFGIGVQSQQNGPDATQYVLRNSAIHHNIRIGLLGDGRNIVIENNLFEANNPSGSNFNHALYLAGTGRNGTLRNNRFIRNSVANGRCAGGNITVHGVWEGLLIEGNTVEQDAADFGCYGISVNQGSYPTPEGFRGLVVRNNRLFNLGGCSVCLTSAPGAIVENNLIVNTQATQHIGIVVPDRAADPDDAQDGGAIIRNNTVVLHRAGEGSEGISLRPNAGTNLQVVSNLIYYGSGSNAQHACFVHQARGNYAAFDNNLCHHANGGGRWSTTHATPGAANQAGFDIQGVSIDPLFVTVPAVANGYNDLIQPTSPARQAGHPTLSSAADRVGVPRVVPSIGAREPAPSAGATAK